MKTNKEIILEKALPIVPFEGWSNFVLQEAAKQASLSELALKRAFPNGITGLVDYFFENSDQQLIATCPPENLAKLKIPERIKLLILTRLENWLPNCEAVRRAIAHQSLIWNIPHASKNFYKTIDLIWQLAGDNSTDFNFYTKRMTLAAVYSSTILFWLNDNSLDKKDTAEFLDRRLTNVADFGKWKKRFAG